MAWAQRVAMPREYLEFPDILLYAAKNRWALQVFIWAKGAVCLKDKSFVMFFAS